MLIRNVKESDFEEIYSFVKTAFETAKNSTGNEREFVSEIRNRDTYIPECEFIAEKDGKIIGHVILSKLDIETDDGGVFHGVRVEQIVVAEDERDNRLGGVEFSMALELNKLSLLRMREIIDLVECLSAMLV